MIGTLNNQQIERVLRSEVIGRIGCCSGDEMYVVPVSYVFHEGYIYAHSKEGLKIQMMRKNAKVCFEVDSIDDMTNWRSVIIFGMYEELRDHASQETALQIIREGLAPFVISDSVHTSKGNSRPPEVLEKAVKPVVYRIKIMRSSGRFEKK
jgi:nitroimidazol reductase NimA-like FMN-containing flavoprotein (pyridoxamine 5'-phosphate oxidase superfamily)